jgi:hypothetical protein
MSLNLIDISTLHDTSILLLNLIDNSIESIDYAKINDLLANHDIIVHEQLSDKSLCDFYFIFKKNNIYVLQNLYDNYLKYCTDWENDINRDDLTTTRPEALFYYHFMLNNKKIAFEKVIEHKFVHICNIYCGHNGINAKMI